MIHDGIFKSVVLEEYKTKIGGFTYEQFRLICFSYVSTNMS